MSENNMNTSSLVETIKVQGDVYAVVIRSDLSIDGIEFFTPDDFPQQLGYMSRPEGYKVEPHRHKTVTREIERTQETLIIRSGRVRVQIYDDSDDSLESLELGEGDVILFAAGGHSVEMLEDTEILEIKQGPYGGDDDKRPVDTLEED